MFNCVICRYHEIATKGNNRNMFERCLVENIRHQIRGLAGVQVRRVRGRVWVEHTDHSDFSDDELAVLKGALPRVFGLESFSISALVRPEIGEIRSKALTLAQPVFNAVDAAKPVSFRIRARRSNKKFPFRSQEMEIDLVTRIADAVGREKFTIDLDHAELTLGCEVRDEFAILFWDSIAAPGGLPTGSNPRVLTLLSGGIDSPVAAYLMMKRGSPTDYITFHSSPYTPPETTEKVKRIADHLNRFQISGKLHMVNLAPFQREVRDRCQERLRTVLYRRAMMRIAESVARSSGCRALVTGEALGQVASQTLVNLDTINRSIEMLVLRPIIGEDKLETIRAAEAIGTMELSAPQVPDSCTVFAPSSPSTAVPLSVAEKEELKIPGYGELLQKIIDDIEIYP